MGALVKPEVAKLIHEQTARELAAHNIYQSMALWAKRSGYMGSAKWFQKASGEEIEHRNKMLDFLNDFGCVCDVLPDPKIHKTQYDSLQAAFQAALDLELEVSNYIFAIHEAIDKAKDGFAYHFWLWFMDEQEQSVRELTDILAILSAAGENLLEADEAIGDD